MQTALRQMPPGMFPANVLKYDAASVPDPAAWPFQQDPARAGNLRSRQQLHPHAARHRAGRFRLLSVRRKTARVMVDLNLDELYAKQLSPIDVSNALNSAEPDPARRHRQDSPKTEYQVTRQQQPDAAGRSEQSADQDRERRDGLHQRRGAGARRLFGAEQHRAHQRIARRADDHHAQRQGVHARHRQRGEGGAAQNSGQRAAGVESDGAGRSVRLRARLHPGRGARSADRRRPHRPDDPAVSGKLAQHADRLHLDSAFHSDLALAF